jgi:hypothetical protein
MPNTRNGGQNMTLRWKVILGAVLLLSIAAFFLPVPLGFRETAEDPLCASIEEDPCYADVNMPRMDVLLSALLCNALF